ncbi:hypothetical protein EMCRGX_G017200 [Ephydatia muelleri]
MQTQKKKRSSAKRESYQAEPEKKQTAERERYQADPEKKQTAERERYKADPEKKRSAKGNVIGRVPECARLAKRVRCGKAKRSTVQNQRGHRKSTTDKVIQRFAYAPYGVLRKMGVNGPTPRPFWGNAREFTKDPFTMIQKLRDTYGDVSGFYIGAMPAVVIADQELLKSVLVKQFVSFSDRIYYDRKFSWN